MNETELMLHYMFLILGLVFLMSGLREFRLNNKRTYFHFFVALLCLVDFFIWN
ncbi:DUF3953 domain-containing protein [Bacillus sp. AFS017336]|uniref:DUF3953 domain-containing protein n=1 Tax=unclassified Bacillus (in: firmicutes) TaxID=185979 RepID=UPI00359FA184